MNYLSQNLNELMTQIGKYCGRDYLDIDVELLNRHPEQLMISIIHPGYAEQFNLKLTSDPRTSDFAIRIDVSSHSGEIEPSQHRAIITLPTATSAPKLDDSVAHQVLSALENPLDRIGEAIDKAEQGLLRKHYSRGLECHIAWAKEQPWPAKSRQALSLAEMTIVRLIEKPFEEQLEAHVEYFNMRRSKRFGAYLEQCQYRAIVTGTPIEERTDWASNWINKYPNINPDLDADASIPKFGF